MERRQRPAGAEADVFATLTMAGNLLGAPPWPLALDGKRSDGALRPAVIGIHELAGLLPVLTPADLDRVWVLIVENARSGDPAWRVAATWLALPALRRIVHRYRQSGVTDADLPSVVLAKFVDSLDRVDDRILGIFDRLIQSAAAAGFPRGRAGGWA